MSLMEAAATELKYFFLICPTDAQSRLRKSNSIRSHVAPVSAK